LQHQGNETDQRVGPDALGQTVSLPADFGHQRC
jgi:hypothetical protein